MLSTQGEIPRQALCTPHAARPLARKQNRTGVTRLSTCTKRGGI